MSNNRVYIAGAISSDPDYIVRFGRAERLLTSDGYAVINPVKNVGFDYKDYIDMGLNELMHCDAIYMLDGYINSPGARLEKLYAETVGLEIMYERL